MTPSRLPVCSVVKFHKPSLPKFCTTPLLSNDGDTIGGLEDKPAAVNVFPAETADDALGDLLEMARSESENGGARAGEARAQQPLLRAGGHGLHDLAEPRDQCLPVLLVQPILHR